MSAITRVGVTGWRRWAVGTLTSLAAVPLAVAAAATAWSGRMEAVASSEWVRAPAGSPFARVADLPDMQGKVELRPELKWESAVWTAALKPSAVATYAEATPDWDLRLSEGSLRWRPQPGLSLLAGREVLLWGPATFWNPSNPFFTENNRDNPQRELDGIDLVRARWQLDRAWSMTAIAQFGRGGVTVTAPRRSGLKLDWVGEAASAALVAATAPSEQWSVHAWAQSTVSDAWLIYGETAWSEAPATAWPELGATRTGWSVVSRAAGDRTLKVLVGGAYTLLSGITVTLEAWHSGAGWDSGQRARFSTALRTLGTQPRGLADAQIGSLLLGVPEPFGKNRAGIQVMNAGEGRTGWLLRSTRGLDEGGGEWLAYVRRDLSDSVQLWSSAVRRYGPASSAFGRSIRSAVSVGVTWRPW